MLEHNLVLGEPTANQSKAKERKIRLDLNSEELGKHNIA